MAEHYSEDFCCSCGRETCDENCKTFTKRAIGAEAKMIESKGYTLIYDKNRITITLPQIVGTVTTTTLPTTNRKAEMLTEELSMILSVVRFLFEWKG